MWVWVALMMVLPTSMCQICSVAVVRWHPSRPVLSVSGSVLEGTALVSGHHTTFLRCGELLRACLALSLMPETPSFVSLPRWGLLASAMAAALRR